MGRLSILGPHGYHVEYSVERDGGAKENDTYTCQHCGKIILVKDRDQPQAVCRRCDGMVCEECSPRGKCHPITNPNRDEWMDCVETLAHTREIKSKLGMLGE